MTRTTGVPGASAASIVAVVRPAASDTTSRSGGTLPIVPALVHNGIPVVVTGVALPDSNIHSPNERILVDYVPLGIAGVMGGASAEISDSTTDVALEMAWFLPRSVGKTARRLGLRTEAAARFEAGGQAMVHEVVERFSAAKEQLWRELDSPAELDRLRRACQGKVARLEARLGGGV